MTNWRSIQLKAKNYPLKSQAYDYNVIGIRSKLGLNSLKSKRNGQAMQST
jgi:hypothetical protein